MTSLGFNVKKKKKQKKQKQWKVCNASTPKIGKKVCMPILWIY